METKIIQVEGMSCQHCIHSIKTALEKIKGVSKVEVDLQGKKVTVELDPQVVTLDMVKEAIEDQGYHVP